ncbi:MAG TPA: peroxidase family protein, partial [Chloroflexota bacterium]|nr:peroxidase family protein [Chloroflexota bacterium]
MKGRVLWALVGIAIVAVLKRRGLLPSRAPGSLLTRLFVSLAQRVDQQVGWDKLPVPLGLLTLIGLRIRLRQQNLYDTSPPETVKAPVVHLGTPSAAVSEPPPSSEPGVRHFSVRTADGTYNDLANPHMGSAGTRFGRNFPLEYTYPDEKTMLVPNPRVISRELLVRETF